MEQWEQRVGRRLIVHLGQLMKEWRKKCNSLRFYIRKLNGSRKEEGGFVLELIMKSKENKELVEKSVKRLSAAKINCSVKSGEMARLQSITKRS